MQKRMEALEGYVSGLADELLDDLLARDHGDTAVGLAHPLPMRVIAERVIGFREPDAGRIQHWVLEGSPIMGGRLSLDQMVSVGEQVSGMGPWVTSQLDEALTSPGDGDVLSAAAAGVRSGVLTRDEAAFTLMVLVGAGGETTTTLIGNAIAILAEHLEVQEGLRANPARVPAFIEEVPRFESPFNFHPRRPSLGRAGRRRDPRR